MNLFHSPHRYVMMESFFSLMCWYIFHLTHKALGLLVAFWSNPHFYVFSISLFSVFCFIPLVFCWCNSTISSGPSWKFHFISSHLILFSFFFPLKVCAAFFCSPKDWAAVQCGCFRARTRCALRSSHDARFLPHKARVWAGRLSDPQGNTVLELIVIEYSKAKCVWNTAA